MAKDGNQYGTTQVSGNATAVLGNVENVYATTIQRAMIVLNGASIVEEHSLRLASLERQLRVLEDRWRGYTAPSPALAAQAALNAMEKRRLVSEAKRYEADKHQYQYQLVLRDNELRIANDAVRKYRDQAAELVELLEQVKERERTAEAALASLREADSKVAAAEVKSSRAIAERLRARNGSTSSLDSVPGLARIIVAVHYGVTHTRVSYVSSNYIKENINVMTEWPYCRDPSYKVPSVIAYRTGQKRTWGFEATASQGGHYKTRLLLEHNSGTPNSTAPKSSASPMIYWETSPTLPNDKTAETVIRDFLAELHKLVIRFLENTISIDMLEILPVDYWFTVPDYWSGVTREHNARKCRECRVRYKGNRYN